MKGPHIKLKRAYEAWSRDDGQRILVDRIWSRGVTKAELHLDCWTREIAPSTELRRWFGHDRAKWEEFKRRYFRELAQRRQMVDGLLHKLGEGTLTLVFAAGDARCNNAVALKEYLEHRVQGDRSE